RAAAVWCDFTASSTTSRRSGIASGVAARTRTVTAPSARSMVSPWAFIASTCARSMSTSSTSRPARARAAPVMPPIAPAPYTVTAMTPPDYHTPPGPSIRGAAAMGRRPPPAASGYNNGSMDAPLADLLVADLTQNVAGPYCAQILGDLGADVVKIERIGRGDDARAWAPPYWGEESATFMAVNRNKRSLSVDLKDPE